MISDYNRLVDTLECAFPDLHDKIKETIDWSGEVLNHVIFGQVFNPHIKNIFINYTNNNMEVEKMKLATFLEDMATSDDSNVRAVLTDTILEELLDNPKEFAVIEPYLLAKTTSLLPLIKKALGITNKMFYE